MIKLQEILRKRFLFIKTFHIYTNSFILNFLCTFLQGYSGIENGTIFCRSVSPNPGHEPQTVYQECSATVVFYDQRIILKIPGPPDYLHRRRLRLLLGHNGGASPIPT